MSASLGTVLPFLTIPVGAIFLGGIIASFAAPSRQAQSLFQHFAAGVVLAAVAGEVLPEIDKLHNPGGVIIGFTAGTALLLALKAFLDKYDTEEESDTPTAARAFPRMLVVVVGVDVLIDGLLLGSSFGAGERLGKLLTLALTIELLFLSLSTATVLLGSTPRSGMLMAIAGIGLAFALGAVVGAGVFIGFQGFWLEVVLSFSAAALLYLVVEELLTEAHTVPETPLLTASFFVGFLALYMLEAFA